MARTLTVIVYGAVAVLVKIDDIGLKMAKNPSRRVRHTGTRIVRSMPAVFRVISVIGTVAMLWVGGGIFLHGAEELGLPAPAHLAHDIQHAVEHATGALGGVLGWLTYAGLSAVVGMVLGTIIALLLHKVLKFGAH